MLKKSIRWVLWLTLSISCSLSQQSSGIMSQAGAYIKTDLGVPDALYGCISGVYAVGRMGGTILICLLINAVNRKLLMVTAMLFQCVMLLCFLTTKDIWLLLFLRIMAGIPHVFPIVYGPIWIDQYANPKNKYLWSSILSMASPFGRASGFLMDLFLGSEQWRNSFIVNATGCALASLIFFYIPNIYYSSKLIASRGKDGNEELTESETLVVSLFNIRESEENERDINWFSKYSEIFTNMVYIFLLLARVEIISINSIYTFWIPSYVTEVLKYTNKFNKTIVYCLMITFGPFCGSFIGSYAVKMVGGYENKNSILVVLIFNILAAIVVTPMPYMNVWWHFLLNCTAFHLFGNAVLPNLNSILLSCIPHRLRAKGYVIANVVSAFMGGLPSPTIYGLINDKWKHYDDRFSMKCYVILQWIGVFWTGCALFFRYKRDNIKEMNEPLKDRENSISFQDANKDFLKFESKKNQKDDEEKELEDL